jgi:hypothetical protein
MRKEREIQQDLVPCVRVDRGCELDGLAGWGDHSRFAQKETVALDLDAERVIFCQEGRPLQDALSLVPKCKESPVCRLDLLLLVG